MRVKTDLIFIASVILNVFFVSAADIHGLIGIGRSIADIISSGINDFQTIHKDLTFTENIRSDQGLTSDDVFSGLNDIWNDKFNSVNKVQNKDRNTHIDNSESDTNLSTKDTVNDKNDLTSNLKVNVDSNVDNSTEKEIDVDDSNSASHWIRIRGIVANMRSIFTDMYVKDFDQTNTDSSFDVIKLLDSLMEIGDKINFVKKIENSFDEDLIDFLVDKWVAIKNNVVKMTPSFKGLLATDAKVLFLTVAKGLAKQFGNMFHKQALAHLSEQDFVIETMRSSGFKDKEIYAVFNLLDLPTDELISTSRTLTVTSRGMQSYYKTLDPFTLLAGLGFATFAAYLIYRLLSTTTAPGKRSVDDMFSISMSLSDMPDSFTRIYNWLDKAKAVYEGHDKEDEFINEDTFSNAINGLWRSSKKSRSCVSSYLCNYLSDNGFRSLNSGMSLEEMAMLGLAQLIGAEKSGKLYDRYISQLSEGKILDCRTIAPQCDEIT